MRKNNRKRVTVVTKSNVVKTTMDDFRNSKAIAKEYEADGIIWMNGISYNDSKTIGSSKTS